MQVGALPPTQYATPNWLGMATLLARRATAHTKEIFRDLYTFERAGALTVCGAGCARLEVLQTYPHTDLPTPARLVTILALTAAIVAYSSPCPTPAATTVRGATFADLLDWRSGNRNVQCGAI